jgi:membrane-associated phospholipid phosphatase/tRNA A-37 threonylcarbamoyl transferase component Bud32
MEIDTGSGGTTHPPQRRAGKELLPRTSEPRRRKPRRRPSGDPPPLPRQFGVTGGIWIALAVGLILIIVLVVLDQSLGADLERWNSAFLRRFVSIRADWLTEVCSKIDGFLTSRWTIRILRLGTIVALLLYRRWRHLLTFLGTVVGVEVTAHQLSLLVASPRPIGVEIIGSWEGFSFPSPPTAALAVALVGMIYTLLPRGPLRARGKWAAGVTLLVVSLARMYLAIDHPTDDLAAIILGVGIPVIAFRFFTPNDAFPVTYARGKTAHLDVGGRRGEAIREAVRDQLGLTVLDAKPIGLEGSGGSTPLRLRVAATEEEPERYLFAKLYAKSHVRADRSYKLGRTILYGALEDEAPFQTVRRFVEYEDYALLLLNHLGIPSPAPFGFVEITPEREYMIVMEFFEGAQEIGDADVDDGVIDEGLLLIRRLWDAGLAHRDIKPANLMVRDGRVLLIDVFFVQVRPSPWRQAVDLANMMLVLAVRTDAKRVYERALMYFTDDDIAEAFAATRGVASPTQLRQVLKRDGRDLVAEFRTMAPERPRLAIQRWTMRRIALSVAVVTAAVLAILVVVNNWTVVA